MSSKNQSECSKAYETIKGQVETGISTLLKYREQDMYREYFPRVVYETTRKQKAPIPPVDVLESILRLQNDSQNPM